MKEPVDHILRPRLPWRSAAEPAITECGYDASKVKTLTREEFVARLKDFGRTRTAMVTCMTCSETAQRWGTWEQDPRNALEREVLWETRFSRNERGVRLRDELEALAHLAAAHRDQFERLLDDIAQRREWLKKKAEREGPPPPTPGSRRRL